MTDLSHSQSIELLEEVEARVASGQVLAALDVLAAADPEDPAALRRLAEVRRLAFDHLPSGGFDRWPVAVDGLDHTVAPTIPEVEAGELTADHLRRSILQSGSLLVRGLFAGHCERFIEGIETAFTAKAEVAKGGPEDDAGWYHSLRLAPEEAQSLGRHWVAGAGGLLTCDSPRLLQMLLQTYSQLGLHGVLEEYLGERPVLSANKCTLRKVPLTTKTDWHQDGAFLGEGIRAMNIWIALSDCGVDSPGMDLVPKRFDAVCETGTGGAYFDWAVGSETVAEVSADAPVVRPHFQAGDALLFDELFLHRTAIDPSMSRERYAIESWFFAPTTYPAGQVPLVW
jgi:hypothetical protein